MSSSPITSRGVTLEEFLRMPEIDEEAPYLEYIDGRIEAKAMPTWDHVRISKGFDRRLDRFIEERGLGISGQEVRYTFGGRSILPDVSFQAADRVALRPDGRAEGRVIVPPDIHVEVVSPEQATSKNQAKILFSMAHGCGLGILVHPENRTIDVYRPGRTPERLSDDGAIDFAPVLPGLVVPVAEVFTWAVIPPLRPEA